MTTHFELSNRATVQIPSGDPGEAPRSFPAFFRSVENKRLHVTTRERLRSGTALSVQYEDAMFLGEVIACSQDLDDCWHSEIYIEQILTGLQSLMNLRAHLLGESAKAESVGTVSSAAIR